MRRPNSEVPGHSEPIRGDWDEFDLIELLRARFEARGGQVRPGDLGIGDDAAAVTLPDPGRVVLATDLVVAGVHVDPGVSTPEDIGWKSLMVTVSDLAAMGAGASFVLLSVAAPRGFPVERLGEGVAEAAVAAGCKVVGGDLAGSATLVVSATAVGSVPDDGVALLRRDGAGAGDHLFVTGPLGASAAGLRLLTGNGGGPGSGSETVPEPPSDVASDLVAAHRRPIARLPEGAAARSGGASAAIDVSDGLLADVLHVAKASGVGLDLRIGAEAVAAGATRAEALTGGEDYELVLATNDPDQLLAAFAAAGLRTPLAIGRCTTRPGTWELDGGPLPDGGWHHRF